LHHSKKDFVFSALALDCASENVRKRAVEIKTVDLKIIIFFLKLEYMLYSGVGLCQMSITRPSL
jgi:hypothetical protein